MLRFLLQVLSQSRDASRPVVKSGPPTKPRRAKSDPVVLYARFDHGERNQSASPHQPLVMTPRASHRERLLSMQLSHIAICSERRVERLAEIGIETAGDLLVADRDKAARAMQIRQYGARTIRRYCLAIRLAASVPGMMPRDAMILISIHRRSVQSLAIESPAKLHRDIERFALSSRGQKQLRGRRLPSLRRIRAWVEACAGSATEQPGLA